MSNQNKRPPNCGTDYCSCIECIYGDNGCVADEEQCNDGCLARESVIANALKLANDIDAEFFKGRISNHSGRQAAQMLRMLVDAPVQPVKQEPVACQFPRQPNNEGGWTIDAKFLNIIVKDMADDEFAVGMEETEAVLLALERSYSAPVSAKREWVELTDDEIMKIWYIDGGDTMASIAHTIIAAFKEKNK